MTFPSDEASALVSAKALCCPISTGPKPFRLGAGSQKSGRGSAATGMKANGVIRAN